MIEQLVEALLQRAELNWRSCINEDGRIYIRRDDVVEHELEQLGAEHLYDELVNHPLVVATVEEMRIIAQDAAEDEQSSHRMWGGTMAEMLAERGMSYRDFI
jgi:hypothetical protein